jgi:non-heme chloroperoxidase
MAARVSPNTETPWTPTLKIYPGESHGICTTQKDQVNADLLAFLEEKS